MAKSQSTPCSMGDLYLSWKFVGTYDSLSFVEESVRIRDVLDVHKGK